VSLDQTRATRRFYQFVWPHRADVLRVAQFLCRNRATAEDLAQEALLKAFRAIDRLEAGPNVRAWLHSILRNTWVDRLRATSAHRELSLSDLNDEPAAVVPEDAPCMEALNDPQAALEVFSDQEVIDALQALPAEIRWTLLLVDIEGLSVQEAADVLDVPPGTIKSRAHRGRAMLREKLLPMAAKLKWTAGDGTSPASDLEAS
jgi:RNA polymerase sigma-70 factor, ECF subfamily